MIYLVVAVSKNRVIGGDNKLLWNLPEDLKRFKKITTNQAIVMGRKTHLSIGKSLPNRLNIILTNNFRWNSPLGDNCVVCYSIEEVIERFKHRDLYVIGGGEIYKQFLPIADRIFLTLIDKEFKGDTYFPNLNSDWVEDKIESHKNDDFEYHFIDYKKNI
jgi:dihydrofolate reductase